MRLWLPPNTMETHSIWSLSKNIYSSSILTNKFPSIEPKSMEEMAVLGRHLFLFNCAQWCKDALRKYDWSVPCGANQSKLAAVCYETLHSILSPMFSVLNRLKTKAQCLTWYYGYFLRYLLGSIQIFLPAVAWETLVSPNHTNENILRYRC